MPGDVLLASQAGERAAAQEPAAVAGNDLVAELLTLTKEETICDDG